MSDVMLVSPEFRLRPSLSAGDEPRVRRPRVAGVQTPAFVERRRAIVSPVSAPVSPEFRLRPSLSGRNPYQSSAVACVAGVQTPAFVERAPRRLEQRERRPVSPEFRFRPSLSGLMPVRASVRWRVSPEFRLRPSLSDLNECRASVRRTRSVAGAQTPAFVKRRRRLRRVPVSGHRPRLRAGAARVPGRHRDHQCMVVVDALPVPVCSRGLAVDGESEGFVLDDDGVGR